MVQWQMRKCHHKSYMPVVHVLPMECIFKSLVNSYVHKFLERVLCFILCFSSKHAPEYLRFIETKSSWVCFACSVKIYVQLTLLQSAIAQIR